MNTKKPKSIYQRNSSLTSNKLSPWSEGTDEWKEVLRNEDLLQPTMNEIIFDNIFLKADFLRNHHFCVAILKMFTMI